MTNRTAAHEKRGRGTRRCFAAGISRNNSKHSARSRLRRDLGERNVFVLRGGQTVRAKTNSRIRPCSRQKHAHSRALFSRSRIISVEYDRQSENAAAAETKLKPCSNVELLYGDSREILPERLQTGDAVLIDGPKDFRALKLAVDLLRTGKPCAVFVHDFPPNSPQRKFVERNWPNAFFGDDPLFQRFQSLDNERDPRPNPQRRYGTFVCLPPPLPAPYFLLRLRLMLHGNP